MARAQQVTLPVIGVLSATPAMVGEKRMVAFRRGLTEMGYIEGQNVSIISLAAEGKLERLPTLAGELVRRQVSVIVPPQSIVGEIAARDATWCRCRPIAASSLRLVYASVCSEIDTTARSS